MYSTYNAFRARWTPHGVVKETTGSNGGEWGVTQDNDGKMWFQGRRERRPGYWQFPIVYGNFAPARTAMDPDCAIPVGRARARRRHAGRHGHRPHARRLARSRRRPAPAA